MSVDSIDAPEPRYRAPDLTDELVEKALYANYGIMAAAGRDLGVTRAAIQLRVKNSARLQAVVEECIETRLDLAEQNLTQLTLDKDLGSICFTLKTLGKRRGYGYEKEDHQIDFHKLKAFVEYFDARKKLIPPPVSPIVELSVGHTDSKEGALSNLPKIPNSLR